MHDAVDGLPIEDEGVVGVVGGVDVVGVGVDADVGAFMVMLIKGVGTSQTLVVGTSSAQRSWPVHDLRCFVSFQVNTLAPATILL